MKPYKLIPIKECGEPLVPIPADRFAFVHPHPYEAVGAPYDDKSPFYVRQGVLDRLFAAQATLAHLQPGWKILIFDAYRPLGVQEYMVDHTFGQVVAQRGLEVALLTEAQRQEILTLVYEFWAVPDRDPRRPPPHSTGGAVDVTLVDERGVEIDMGSPIDELSPRSYPNYYGEQPDPVARSFQERRSLLHHVMSKAGFLRHPGEWWHFCYGDQMWAWLQQQAQPDFPAIAQYGRWENDEGIKLNTDL